MKRRCRIIGDRGTRRPFQVRRHAVQAAEGAVRLQLRQAGRRQDRVGYIKNHLQATKQYGDPKNSHIVIVAHGNELHGFSRLNRAAFPEMYDELKTLKDAGVTIHVCANAARSRGYKPDEFYDVITVVPAAVIDIAKWQNEGYSDMYAERFPRLTREEPVKQRPELQ